MPDEVRGDHAMHGAQRMYCMITTSVTCGEGISA
jgi:hypothetical protein